MRARLLCLVGLAGMALPISQGCQSKARVSAGDAASGQGASDHVDASSGAPTGRPGTVVVAPADAAARCGPEQALELYESRIQPLFQDDHPSTCGQCHAAGVDLEMFVRADPCQSFACLVEQGLVDTIHPERSKLLELIGQAEPDSELITKEVIAKEQQGFAEWLTYNVECKACQGATCSSADAGERCERTLAASADPAAEDPGGCSDAALETVFRQTIYASRGRCSPCHYNDHDDEEAPQWIEVNYGCDEAARRTLQNVRERGLIDPADPAQSLLLLKPLAESQGGLPHGGGDKFVDEEDPGYATFKYFVDRYAACLPDASAAAAP